MPYWHPQRPVTDGFMWCSHCNTELPREHFPPSVRAKANKNSDWCKPCRNARYRQRTKDDPGMWSRYQMKYRSRKQDAITAIKVARGCADCGIRHPGVLSLHHTDPSTKADNISTMLIHARPMSEVMAEFDKGIVLCENCHRIRHWHEREALKMARRKIQPPDRKPKTT